MASIACQLIDLLKVHIPEGAQVLEIDCRSGELLAGLKPLRGVATTSSEDIIRSESVRYPDLHFFRTVEQIPEGKAFDYVILSEILTDTHDVQRVFQVTRDICRPDARIIIVNYNAAWGPLLRFATALGLRRQTGEQNWLSVQDLSNLLYLADCELIRHSGELLFPFPAPLLAGFFNRFVVRFWPFTHLGLVQLLIARTTKTPSIPLQATVSVIVPTRNERGTIAAAVERIPEMGGGTEIIFVDGDSTDGTVAEIEKEIAANAGRNIRLLKQVSGKGKGDAVRQGFAAATGDALMILDADLTVPPETLPRFFDALVTGKGELVNGTRLVYPMEQEAMRFLNKVANRFFSIAFTWLLNQPIRDTLCGTKALSRRNYMTLAAHRSYFGFHDPFGDFDLLLGAARANLRIVEIPIRYEARRYGVTNIRRFSHGLLLLKMTWLAFRRLKLR